MANRVHTPSPYSAIVGLLVIVFIIVGGLFLLNRIEAENPTPQELTLTPIPTSKVSFVLNGLTQIIDSEYVIWGESSAGTRLLGAFTLDNARKIVPARGSEFLNNELHLEMSLSAVTRIFITLEQPGTNEQPLGAEILSADIEEGIGALLSPLTALEGLIGEYMLATPTDGPSSNETSGIWFARPDADGGESAGLTLPALPQGWEYSGVVRHQDVLLPIGTFNSGTVADSFSGYSGIEPAPAFPGEDFLTNQPAAVGFDFPINLADGTTEVSIRIVSAAPLVSQAAENELSIPLVEHVVLRGMIMEGATPSTNYPLTPVDLSLPAGIVVIR